MNKTHISYTKIEGHFSIFRSKTVFYWLLSFQFVFLTELWLWQAFSFTRTKYY